MDGRLARGKPGLVGRGVHRNSEVAVMVSFSKPVCIVDGVE